MDYTDRREHWIFKSHTKRSQPESEPFSYSYVIEDGKLPFIAEHHPVRVPSVSVTRVQDPKFQAPIARRKSLRKRENAERHSAPLEGSSIPASPSKSEKLKRALSLSSMRSSHGGSRSTQHSRSNSIRSNSPGSNLTAESNLQSGSNLQPGLSLPPMAPVPWMPGSPNAFATMVTGFTPATLTLTLPTPSISPVQSLRSSESRPSSPMSTASSFMTAEDRIEFFNLQRAAMGRLSPRPAFPVGRSDKALATLGITSPPYTPPFTPPISALTSKAPSLHDSNGRSKKQDSIRISSTSTTSTAQSSAVENSKASIEKPQVIIQHPRPILKRKTSKFIEHLDNRPDLTSESVSKPTTQPEPEAKRDSMEITTVDHVRFEMLQTAPIRLHNPPIKSGVGIRRTQSMRTTAPASGRWSGIVCTAEARPVVAAGSAKLVSF